MEPTKPSILKRVIKIIGIIIVVLVGLVILIAYLPYIFSLFSRDTATVQDRDLTLPVISIHPEENSFSDFEQLVIPEMSQQDFEKITHVINGQEWDQKFVNEVLQKNANVLQTFDAIAKKPKYQDPTTANPAAISLNNSLPGLNKFRQMARLASIRALNMFKKGEEHQATEEALKIIDLGQKIQNSQGPLIQYLISVPVKSLGLERLLRIIGEARFSPADLNKYGKQLDDYKNNNDGLKTAFKVEYWYIGNTSDVFSGTEFVSYTSGEELESPSRTHHPFYFKPNKTKSLFAADTRRRVQHVDTPCAYLENDEKLILPSTNPIKLYFTENAVGKILHDVASGGLNSAIVKKCELDFLVSAVQTTAALKSYYLATQHYPASLKDLVPTYLPSIPKDPFDGKELKYSQQKKIIYSVGEDGIDTGGSTGTEWAKMPDPTFPFK